MHVSVVDHPIAHQLLTRIRDERTARAAFAEAVDALGGMLVYEATRRLPTEPVTVRTPLADTAGVRLATEPLLAVVLRAGLGLLGAAQRLLPGAPTAFIGVARNEETHEPDQYLIAVAPALEGRPVLLLDPMLATGGSMAHAAAVLRARGAGPITAVCILAAPEGVAAIEGGGLVDELVVAAIDERLNEVAFIVPGLGDAGDRLFGEK